MPSSAQHHSTFCTFDEVVRPQIFSIPLPPDRIRGYRASDCIPAQPLPGDRLLFGPFGGESDWTTPARASVTTTRAREVSPASKSSGWWHFREAMTLAAQLPPRLCAV